MSGFSRLAEKAFRSLTGKGESQMLNAIEKNMSSVVGGELKCNLRLTTQSELRI